MESFSTQVQFLVQEITQVTGETQGIKTELEIEVIKKELNNKNSRFCQHQLVFNVPKNKPEYIRELF